MSKLPFCGNYISMFKVLFQVKWIIKEEKRLLTDSSFQRIDGIKKNHKNHFMFKFTDKYIYLQKQTKQKKKMLATQKL